MAVMRRIFFALSLALMACTAQAQTIGMHLGTMHSERGYNNRNPGLYVNADGWTAGGYCNSESRSERFPDAKACKLSTYAGITFQRELMSRLAATVTVGAITGYRAGVQPMAVPSLLIANHLRIFYVPKREKAGTSAVSFALETTL
jgi:hypothetical protein